MATVSLQNFSKPAPLWFRKSKKALGILTLAANTMVASMNWLDPLMVAQLQLWCTIGIGAIMEAIEAVLAEEQIAQP